MTENEQADRKIGRLTTHVLDTASGRPADGLVIELYRLTNDNRELVKSVTTNSDGRCDEPLLSGDEFQKGNYELVFGVGQYFSRADDTPFLDIVPVRFGVSNDNEHYHVPLLVSPFGYSTYRGS